MPSRPNKIIHVAALALVGSQTSLLKAQSVPSGQGISANEVNIASTFNPVGSGARALGMGNAFIAIADDATAASWNPGGLIQLRKPEIAFVGSYVNRDEDNTFSALPPANSDENVDYADMNYASASIPCSAEYCGKNMIFSFNYQHQFNFDRQLNQNFNFGIDGSFGQTDVDRSFNYEQTGDLYALGLAYAIQVTEEFSFGVSLNIWDDIFQPNEWKQQYVTFDTSETSSRFGGTFTSINNEIRTETNKFSGINVNIGAFWNVYEQDEQKIVIGAVVKTPFTADVERKIERTTQFGSSADNLSTNQTTVFQNEEYDMPISYGFGVSYQISDALTVAGDVYRTEWGDFVRRDANGVETIGFGFTPSSESKVDATTHVRLGGEYRIISQEFGANYIIPLRAGLFYDPVPTNGQPKSVYGFSLGTGIALETFVFDIAYQYRFGDDINSEGDGLRLDGLSQELEEHVLYSSLFIRF